MNSSVITFTNVSYSLARCLLDDFLSGATIGGLLLLSLSFVAFCCTIVMRYDHYKAISFVVARK